MKHSIFTSLIIISTIFIAKDTIANEKSVQLPNYMCNSKHLITPDSFDIKTKNAHQFIFSDRYCINETIERDSINISTLPSLKTVRKIIQRYKEVYDTLESSDEKVAFVDLFLHMASQQHYISLNDTGYKKDSISIIISSSSVSKKSVSGYQLSLFQNNIINKEISKTYSNLLSRTDAITHSSDLIYMVNYVLEGSSKKSLKLSDSSITPLRMAYAGGGDDEDDDFVDEWEEEDEEYRDWAEEQAEGWGEDWQYLGTKMTMKNG